MKTMKVALLATAALAAFSASARADDAAAIKAQLEALTARIAQLEAAPAVPTGFSLLTVSKQDAIVVPGLDADMARDRSVTATTIGIVPAADAPASTVIQWSGSVRAALAYQDVDYDVGAFGSPDGADSEFEEGDDLHIFARGRLDVTGTTDTAVGEVGASMSIFGDFDGSGSASVLMDYAWGWWKMTPELTFAGGYNGSLATIGYGVRAIGDAYVTRGGVGVDGGDFTQFRLSYDSGPLGLAIALEHTDEDDNDGFSSVTDGGPLGVAGELTWKGDTLGIEVAGFLRDAGDETQSQIGVGVLFGLSDMIAISASAGFGNNVSVSDADGSSMLGDGWDASVGAVATLSDSVSAELGAGISEYEDQGLIGDDTEVFAVIGGVYWSPVSQLKIGAQASWQNREDDEDELDDMRAAFVTWWNF